MANGTVTGMGRSWRFADRDVRALVLDIFSPLNRLADPYRRDQRMKAMREWAQKRTPDSKALYDHECQLLNDHFARMALVTMAAVVVEGGTRSGYHTPVHHAATSPTVALVAGR
jgi:hypothetical protein